MILLKRFLVITLILMGIQCNRDPAPQGADQEEAAADVDNRIVLLIGNRTFRNHNLKLFIQNQYSDLSGISDNEPLLSRVFDFFVEHALILCRVEDDNINLNEIEISDYLNTMQIQDELTQKTFRDSVKIQKYLYFTVYHKIDVAEQEIRNHYNQNKADFERGDEVLLYQIMVKDKDEATRISGMLKNYPNKFREIARRESESMEAKDDGLMGYFELGTLPREMEDVVFALRTNEISPPVESPYGYHIFKVTKKRKKRMLFYSAVKEDIKKNLLAEKLRSAYQEFLNQLKSEYKIRVFHHNLFFSYRSNQGETINETE